MRLTMQTIIPTMFENNTKSLVWFGRNFEFFGKKCDKLKNTKCENYSETFLLISLCCVEDFPTINLGKADTIGDVRVHIGHGFTI